MRPPRRALLTLWIALLAIVAVGIGGCGDEEEAVPVITIGADGQTVGAPGTTVPGAESTESTTEAAPEATVSTTGPTNAGSGQRQATIRTSEGEIVIDLATEISPKTTERFIGFVEDGFYDGLTFHRIVPGFVIQGGDPKGDGTGGSDKEEVVEAPPADFQYGPGTVAMAKKGTDPAGTADVQFFICVTGDACKQSLRQGATGADEGPQYAVLGQVTTGQEIADKISELEVGPDGQTPKKKVTIEDIAIGDA